MNWWMVWSWCDGDSVGMVWLGLNWIFFKLKFLKFSCKLFRFCIVICLLLGSGVTKILYDSFLTNCKKGENFWQFFEAPLKKKSSTATTSSGYDFWRKFNTPWKKRKIPASFFFSVHVQLLLKLRFSTSKKSSCFSLLGSVVQTIILKWYANRM